MFCGESNAKGIGACFFSSFHLSRMMCVRYHMEICEKVPISLGILCGKILRFVSCLVVVMWIAPLKPTVMTMGSNVVHCCWASNGCRMACFFFQLIGCGCFREFVVAICEFEEFYFKLWVGCEWGFS